MNFYFVNGALLVPTFGQRDRDRQAIEILQTHLPKHKVIGVDCRKLIWGLGAIHCLTQQQPRCRDITAPDDLAGFGELDMINA